MASVGRLPAASVFRCWTGGELNRVGVAGARADASTRGKFLLLETKVGTGADCARVCRHLPLFDGPGTCSGALQDLIAEV